MNSIEKLTEIFTKFPGIGPRQAQRFVYYLLTRNQTTLQDIARLIQELRSDTQECTVCHRFFHKNRSDTSGLCSIDQDSRRDTSLLMIVSRDVDLENIERSHSYNGTYFVLGGSVPVLEKEPEKKVRQHALLELIQQKTSSGDLREIIIAMNATPEGDNTVDYLMHILKPFVAHDGNQPNSQSNSGTSAQHTQNIKISVLGRGISTGTELEYSDSDTLRNALENRH